MTGYPVDEVVLSYGVTSGIEKGLTYQFRYRAKNAQGWGEFSEVLNLIAARRSDQIDPVVTSNEGTDVRITWTEPDYDGGSPLHGYRIKIKSTADGQFYEYTDTCNGLDQTTKANMFCLIKSSVLRSAPYEL